LNKKRDALRRGIRALIHETSKELVSFGGEGPPPGPVPPDAAPVVPAPPSHHEAPSLNGGAAASRHLDEPASPVEEPEGRPRAAMAADTAGAAIEPEAAAPDVTVASTPPIAGAHPAPASASRAAGTVPPRAEAAKAKRGRAKRQRLTPPGRRAAPVAPDEVEADAVPPVQPEARTGVCRSYFVNHECWRVPNAYCNTALQVCVIRNCPVYHLHKDALERRFAKKFKHFW